MKSILFFLFFGVGLNLTAQTTFRILEPASLSGVYPFKAASVADWGSPDLSVTGNWFVDTLFAANDGTIGEACEPLINSLTGNFGIARRSGCDPGTILTQMQNAGATGAIIIDTVDGRPLAFPSDPLSPGVTIPFLLVSKSQGDSILARLANNETVRVGIGNKGGVHSLDLGMYKDRCLWCRYAANHGASDLVDTDFGAWVYNRGTISQADVVLSLQFSDAALISQIDSDPFDLSAGDSAFVSFTLPAANPLIVSGDYTMSYRLLVPADEDTTDNAVSSIIRMQNTTGSYVLDYPLYTAANVDYLLPGSSPDTGDSTACFIIRQPANKFAEYLCEIKVKIQIDPALLPAYLEVDASLSAVQNANGVPDAQQMEHLTSSQFFDVIETSDYELVIPVNGEATGSEYYSLCLMNLTSTPFRLLFSSDYYPDERIADGQSLQAFYYLNYNLPVPEFTAVEKELTPVVEFWHNNWCASGVGELAVDPFTVFPNPSGDFISIQTELPWKAYEISDLSGSSCGRHSFEGEPISVESLASGVYFIGLVDAYGRKYRQLFVKN